MKQDTLKLEKMEPRHGLTTLCVEDRASWGISGGSGRNDVVQGGASLFDERGGNRSRMQNSVERVQFRSIFIFFGRSSHFQGHVFKNAAPLHPNIILSFKIIYILGVQVVVQEGCKWVQVGCKLARLLRGCTLIKHNKIKQIRLGVQGCNLKRRVAGRLFQGFSAFLTLKNYILCSSKTKKREFIFLSVFKKLRLTLSTISIVDPSPCSGSEPNSIPSFPIALYCKSRNVSPCRSNEINTLAILRSIKGAIIGRLNDLLTISRALSMPYPPFKNWSRIAVNPHLYPAINWITFPCVCSHGCSLLTFFVFPTLWCSMLTSKTGGAGGAHV